MVQIFSLLKWGDKGAMEHNLPNRIQQKHPQRRKQITNTGKNLK